VPFLGAIPLDTEIGSLGDLGRTFANSKTAAAKAFEEIVKSILDRLEAQQAN